MPLRVVFSWGFTFWGVMTRLTINLDNKTLMKIKRSARQEQKPLSAWVKEKLTTEQNLTWLARYFDLFGCLKDSDLVRQ